MTDVGIGIGVVCLIVLGLSLRGTSLSKLVREAVQTNDVTNLLKAANMQSDGQRSFFYQRAIQQLWNGYHRVLAARVIRVFAMEYPDEKICQYWLRQLQEMEPEIAAEELDERFLEQHYLPEVAACCGVASS